MILLCLAVIRRGKACQGSLGGDRQGGVGFGRTGHGSQGQERKGSASSRVAVLACFGVVGNGRQGSHGDAR